MHPDEVLAVKMFAGKVVMMREMREGSHDYDMMLNAFAFHYHGYNSAINFLLRQLKFLINRNLMCNFSIQNSL